MQPLLYLKSDPDLAAIPVIVATVVTERGVGYALGAADYLVKPITRERLGAILRRYGCKNRPCLALVVEDDKESRQMLAAILQKEGWDVMEAADGLQGLQAIAGRAPLNGQVREVILKGGTHRESLVEQIREMVSHLLTCRI